MHIAEAGHGRPGGCRQLFHDVASCSMEELTADVVGLLDTIGAERCVLVGHDWA